MSKQRIDRFLSNQSGISRSEVRTGIKRGLAVVNSETVTDFSYPIDPDNDAVFYNGVQVKYKEFIYIMLNKPAGVISASSDRRQKTVLDLVPDNMFRRELSVVGRLDKDTTGLILITDDGEFAHKCISPKSNIEKSYIAELDGDLQNSIIEKFSNGIVLADGYCCKPAEIEIIDKRRARVVITEGKYHQIKRMFGAVGLGVNKLHRERIGELSLPENLLPGECAEIDKKVINSLI